MSEQHIKNEMLNWKSDLENEIEMLKKQIEKNDLDAKLNEYKRNIIDAASENFTIAIDSRQNFYEKYGKSFQSELDKYYQDDTNNKLVTKVRELKCIVHTIDEWIKLNYPN